jgi:hypothetical protein
MTKKEKKEVKEKEPSKAELEKIIEDHEMEKAIEEGEIVDPVEKIKKKGSKKDCLNGDKKKKGVNHNQTTLGIPRSTRKGGRKSSTLTFRQQMMQAMEETRKAGVQARKKRAAGLRAHVDPIIGSEWRGEVQVSTIRLAADAPTLYDGTTIRDGKGQWLAGVEPSSLGDPILESGLHVHPDRPALYVLTESNVQFDLQAPEVLEPKLGEVGAYDVYDAGADKPYCRVAYFPTTGADNAPLARAAATTLRAVSNALVGGESQADERTGGCYVVGGNAVMQSTPEVTQRVVTKDGSSVVVPYTRMDTFLSGVKECISAVATVLGLIADRLHTTFP